jgi:hypothetical protein
MSDPEYIVMDEDPPKYEEELLKSPIGDLNASVVEITAPVIKPE